MVVRPHSGIHASFPHAMHTPTLIALVFALGLSACGRFEEASAPTATAPVVRTVVPQGASAHAFGISATVRARHETPMAFQVGGRILNRHVEAGQNVAAGQLLFDIDPRDLQQAVAASQAELLAAHTAVTTAQAEDQRVQQLVGQGFLSPQARDRSLLAVQEATSRRDAMKARLNQAQNAAAYAQLRTPAAGVLLDVTAQAGQVVSAGQAVAVLARDGVREIEVNLPQGVPVPATGVAVWGEQRWKLRLRETAGAVDALSRTLRARYSLSGEAAVPLPGTVLRAEFAAVSSAAPDSAGRAPVWALPLAALDERGQGAQVWVVKDAQLSPLPVRVLTADGDSVQVQGELQASDRVVSLGTHLLQAGMKVREQAQ